MLMSENSLCSTFLPRPTQVVVVDPLALAITMIMQELGMQLKHASERSPQPVTFKFTHSAVQTISISPLLYVRPLHFRSHNSSSVPTLANITTERECCVLKELWANGWLLVGRSLPKEGFMSGLSSFEYSWVGENCTKSPAQLLFHFQALPLPILNIRNARGFGKGLPGRRKNRFQALHIWWSSSKPSFDILR